MSHRFATLGIGHLREDSNGDGTMDQRGPLLLVAPLLVAAALFLPSIGERIISLEDEARYALLARNMLETGDWLIPRLDGEVHMEKSPLFMWAIAALSLPGRAVTELTATLPSALSAIGGVGATLLLGRRMFGPRVGLLAAFCLATTFGYYWHARLALADMMMTCFIVAGALAFWTGIDGGQARRGPLALFWACLGLGLSAKGPAGLMPILPFTAFLVAERGWRGLRDLKPIMGAAILALVTAPWALAFALQGDESYVQSVLVGDYWAPRRAGWARPSELFFALGPLTIGFLPWTPFLPAAVRQGWWRPETTDIGRKFRFLAVWVLAYVIVITLLPHKRDRYLLPVLPALALMVGWLWDAWAARVTPRTLSIYGWICGGLALALAIAILPPFPVSPPLATLIPLTPAQRLLLQGLLLGSAGAVVAAARAGRPLAMFAAVCVATTLVLAYETRVIVDGHNRAYDVKALSRRLVSRVGPQDSLVTYKLGSLTLELYTGRTIPELQDDRSLELLLTAGRPLYVIVHERRWPGLRDGSGRTWTIVDRAPFGAGQLLVAIPAEKP